MPSYDYKCDPCNLVHEEFHSIFEDPEIRCACGTVCRRLIGRAGKPPGKLVVSVDGYQPGLARFPDDPEAWVDGRASLEKLIDRRRRDGWGPLTKRLFHGS